MAVGVGILYDFPILYFVLLAINVNQCVAQKAICTCVAL